MAGNAVVKASEAVESLKSAILALPEAGKDEEAADMIVARILASKSVTEVLTPQSAPGLETTMGEGIVIHDARWKQSDLNPDVPFYLLLDVELRRSGGHTILSTGSLNVMAQIAKMNELGKIPFPCHVVEVASKSNPGRKAQWLVNDAAEEPF